MKGMPVASRSPGGGPTWWERILFGRVSSGQLAQFCRQFASYLDAGVDFTGRSRAWNSNSPGPRWDRSSAGSGWPSAAARRSKRRWPASRKLRHDVPEHDQRGRGAGRRARDLADDGQPLRGPPAPDPPGPLGHDLPRHRADHGRRRGRADHDLPASPCSRRCSTTSAGKGAAAAAQPGSLAFSSFMRWIGWWLIPLVMVGTPFLLICLYKTSAGKAVMDRHPWRLRSSARSAASSTPPGSPARFRSCSMPASTSAARST